MFTSEISDDLREFFARNFHFKARAIRFKMEGKEWPQISSVLSRSMKPVICNHVLDKSSKTFFRDSGVYLTCSRCNSYIPSILVPSWVHPDGTMPCKSRSTEI